jgi:hypothetical protein
MADFISPGVYSKIIDLSEYVQTVPSTIGFLPIITDRGPDNELVFTNARDFYIDFGEPNINYAGKAFGQGPYIASSFLKESESLYVIRCLPTDACYSNMYFRSTIGPDSTAAVSVVSRTGINTYDELRTTVDDTQDDDVLVIYGVGRGEYYNNYKINLSRPANPLEQKTAGKYDKYILDIYQKQKDLDPVTGSPQYQIISTFEVSFDSTRLDNAGESMFIEDVINRYARYIRCHANKDKCAEAIDHYADFSTPFLVGENTEPIAIENGSSGTLFNTSGIDPTVATTILGRAYVGQLEKPKVNYDDTGYELLEEVLDLDNYYFTVVLDGGYPFDVKMQAVSLVQTRLDCMAFIDNGDNTSYSMALNERTNGETSSINSRYVALYESYSKIFDIYTGRDIWVSPVYHMANIIPYTDNVSEIWYAPAGFNRATIASIKELRYSPRLAERDQFYLNQINPIVKFNVGYTVYGQLTTQRRPTALQDVNIVRLVLYIKRALEQFCKFYIFELNDQETWTAIQQEVNRFLKNIQNRRGLYSYSVEVGANEYEQKSKQVHVNIMLQPTRVIEKIYLNFYIK